MRWEQLFADLEAQGESLAVQERAAEVEQLARAQMARVSVVERLLPSVGTLLTLRCLGGVRVVGVAAKMGSDWLLVDEGHGVEAVVALSGLVSVTGLGRLSAVEGALGPVESRLGMRSVLRAVARDRSAVRLHLVDATQIEGTVDRAGADFVEVAAHAVGELRRRSEVREVVLVPTAAISVLRRRV